MAKLLYKPFGIIAGLIAGAVATRIFNVLWSKLDPEGAKDGPQPKLRETPAAKAVAGTALQAATFAGTKAVVDRASLRTFEHLTGAWAGDKPPKEERAANDG
ncbi:MAG TPA: DUF4235 domain-containing protein [Solirubrobacteraceae bacterium]